MVQPITLAFVDDDRFTAALARVAFSINDRLRLCGIAHSAAEAEGLLQRERPRVVLMDWMLGDGDGAQLIARLAPELPDTRWILTSAFPCAELMVAADRVGAHGAIDKLRFAAPDLFEAIDAVATGGEYFCPASRALMHETLWERGTLHLTGRQRQVLEAIAAHHSRADVARHLGISRAAVSKILGAIAHKLALDGRPTIATMVPAARAARLLPGLPSRGPARPHDAI